MTIHSPSPAPPGIILLPFTIICDSNEVAHGSEYQFSNLPSRTEYRGKQPVVKRIARKLRTADYSIDGWETKVAVERKTLNDLFGTLGGGRERFVREMQLLNDEYEVSAVVIEADFADICNPRRVYPKWESSMKPQSVWGTIFSWMMPVREGESRYPRVHWLPMGSRRLAELATFEILYRFWKEKEETRKKTVEKGEAA